MNVLERISNQAKDHLGLCLGPQKEYLLSARLDRMCLQEGIGSLETFADHLAHGDPGAIDVLSRHLTTNHTYFFREADHFDAIADHLAARRIPRPRIWSAAGSTGEEAYSLAMVLEERNLTDYRILVSDVNRTVLSKARQGRYDGVKMARVPLALARKYFVTDSLGDGEVVAEMRKKLRFQHLNLNRDWDLDEAMDVILCRNVFIYFDQSDTQRVLVRLVDSLKPGGLLCLGLTEGFFVPPHTHRIAPAVYQKDGPNG